MRFGIEALRRYAARADLTMEELVETADTLVRQLAPKQTRYKVTERPDARTIRYYVTQELLPKPVSYEGGRARYSGSHLFRLLLIKKLQAEHHTLARIARVLEESDDDAVLAMLVAHAPEDEPPKRAAAAAAALPAAPVPRLSLAEGGALEVPEEALRDPEKRRRIAESLEALARWLRATEIAQ